MPDAAALGLPLAIHACLFDLDGVLTETATVHAAAWKHTFDDLLRERAHGAEFVPFDVVRDYNLYVDGRPRADGTRAFLASRGIDLPEGGSADPAGAETIHGLGQRKNDLLQHLLRERGVERYEGSVRYVQAARLLGERTAVVSASTNCHAVLASAEIADLFDTVVDGVKAKAEHLAGKPAPDTYLTAARALGVAPAQAAVFEDALAGVEAGRAGHFGFVVGVDRTDQAAALREHGADRVVTDLAALLVAK
jgi:beta-phosphoglucomutase family hydrolase